MKKRVVKMKQIHYILYYAIAKKLPSSYTKYLGIVFNSIRSYFVRGFVKNAGKNITIQKNARIARNIVIGDYSGIGENCVVSTETIIGKWVMMAQDVKIYTSNHRYSSIDIPMCFQGYTEYRPVIIEDDVWIGAGVIILPGVRIGQGAIIGAGSVVTKDVEEYSIVAGNPAKKIKTRCRDSVLKER